MKTKLISLVILAMLLFACGSAQVVGLTWFGEESVTVIRGTIQGDGWDQAIVRDVNGQVVETFGKADCGKINPPCWSNPFHDMQPAWNFTVLDEQNAGGYSVELILAVRRAKPKG